MKVMLDTHSFLWWNADDSQLSAAARQVIAAGSNEIYLSACCAWEIAIKAAKGRLLLPEAADDYVKQRLEHYGFRVLPIELSHVLQIYKLPPLHHDPFDRLLVAQSQVEKLPLISGDSEIARYAVDIIW
ncbi:MAG: type II toxin-antitoxin system VapC family toxin [Caldilinea sp.]